MYSCCMFNFLSKLGKVTFQILPVRGGWPIVPVRGGCPILPVTGGWPILPVRGGWPIFPLDSRNPSKTSSSIVVSTPEDICRLGKIIRFFNSQNGILSRDHFVILKPGNENISS